jgi:hypothetical protein
LASFRSRYRIRALFLSSLDGLFYPVHTQACTYVPDDNDIVHWRSLEEGEEMKDGIPHPREEKVQNSRRQQNHACFFAVVCIFVCSFFLGVSILAVVAVVGFAFFSLHCSCAHPRRDEGWTDEKISFIEKRMAEIAAAQSRSLSLSLAECDGLDDGYGGRSLGFGLRVPFLFLFFCVL